MCVVFKIFRVWSLGFGVFNLELWDFGISIFYGCVLVLVVIVCFWVFVGLEMVVKGVCICLCVLELIFLGGWWFFMSYLYLEGE